MIEHPLRPLWQIRGRHAVVLPAIHEPDDLVRPPLDGVDVKIVRVDPTLERVGATDPVTFAVVAVLLTSIAAGACWLASRRALRVDPLRALRDA